MEDVSLFKTYIEKQRKFITLVKDVQYCFNTKIYKKEGYSFNDYIRKKWNVSQAQAYRYIMCAKVIDQLEDFEIKPSYESLCKSLFDVAKTPIQMKLLWSTILQKTNGRPDCINSTHVNQYWKELCMDEKYSHICSYVDEDDIMLRIENSLNKYNEKKQKQMNQLKKEREADSTEQIQQVKKVKLEKPKEQTKQINNTKHIEKGKLSDKINQNQINQNQINHIDKTKKVNQINPIEQIKPIKQSDKSNKIEHINQIKQIDKMKQVKVVDQMKQMEQNINSSHLSLSSSPIISESPTLTNQYLNTENCVIYTTEYINPINTSLSNINRYSNQISFNEISYHNPSSSSSTSSYIITSLPSTETIYYLPIENELPIQYQNQQQSIPSSTYIPKQSQLQPQQPQQLQQLQLQSQQPQLEPQPQQQPQQSQIQSQQLQQLQLQPQQQPQQSQIQSQQLQQLQLQPQQQSQQSQIQSQQLQQLQLQPQQQSQQQQYFYY